MTHASQRPRADWPTMLIHWGLVAALLVSVSTGWRIAGLTDDSLLLRWVEALLLQGNVLRWHFISATVLVGLVVGYVAFLWRMGLAGRLQLRWASLRSPDRNTRLQAVNKLIYWGAFALLAGAAATGCLLYFFPGLVPMQGTATVHRWLSWGFVFYIALHVVAQVVLGGLRQLLKIITPRMAYGVGAGVALTAGLASAAVAYIADVQGTSTLRVVQARAPILDGDAGDESWQAAPESVVHTGRGTGLADGDVAVHVKALRDGDDVYFLFRWQDPTRSQKHIPLQKTEGGWQVLNQRYDINDESVFYEDKFAVMLARSPIAGGDTVRLGPKPLPDKPGPSNGMGLHVTSDGSLADVWHWKSVRSGSIRQFDDNYFGPPLEAKPGSRYTGGYTQDPKTGGGFEQNFEKVPDSSYVKVKYLPRDLHVQQRRMGAFDPSPEVSDAGDYAMHRSDVVAWTPDLDAKIPVGTVIPSVVYDKPFEGDRGDVMVHAQSKEGWWTLEARRVRETGSQFDQPIENGMFMWVAVFDHTQVRHTRHMRPLRLQLQ